MNGVTTAALRLAPLVWCGLAIAALVLAFVPTDVEAQYIMAALGVGAVWTLSELTSENPADWRRAAVLIISMFISIRYMGWRVNNTLSYADPASFIASGLLFSAELYAFVVFAFGIFVNFFPVRRPAVLLRASEAELAPTVDIFVPSYNEDIEILEVTLRCCTEVRYPKGKLNVYLLDDGGTDQKCSDANFAKRSEAIERRKALRALCTEIGCTYLTRARNLHAKAGNINSAMAHSRGDLILILDADHVPAADILERTVPWFMKDDKVFLVQTPHMMVNPDPVDRNLFGAFRRMPAENEMFYLSIQRGLDFWDSSFFCGSAAILRRAQLDMVGGITGTSITEDAETALELHMRGLKSVYVDQPMVGGLAPESFNGFIIQRMRWTQGMTQIMLLKLPGALGKLTWNQALSYVNSCIFWLFPPARLIFMLSPCLYLFFGLEIYNASFAQIAAFAFPHVIASQVCNTMLFGKSRWPLVSELYEVIQSCYALLALIQVFRNPRQPQFIVTPKGELLDEDFISPMVKPFYYLIAFLGISLGFGVWRFDAYPLSRGLTTFVIFWNCINLGLIMAALGALLERRQRRTTPRMPASVDATFEAPDGKHYRCMIDDVSTGGFRATFDTPPGSKMTFGDMGFVKFWVPARRRMQEIRVEIRASFKMGRKMALGCQFASRDSDERTVMYSLMYGDSEAWSQFVGRRTRQMPFFSALGLLVQLSYHPVAHHIRMRIDQLRARLAKAAARP